MGRLAVGFSVAIAMLALINCCPRRYRGQGRQVEPADVRDRERREPLYVAGLHRRLRHAERNVPAAVTCRATTARPSTTTRRCRIRFSTTAISRSTAPPISRSSAGAPRKAASGCIRRTQPSCSRWCKRKASATPGFRSSRSVVPDPSCPGSQRKSGLPDLRQLISAELGQARVLMASIEKASLKRWIAGSSPAMTVDGSA